MSYFLLPQIYNKTYQYINYSTIENEDNTIISRSLYSYLYDIKNRIDDYYQWDNIKKYTNPYEYIHTNISPSKQPICRYKPISRSYFKMVEIIHTFRLLDIPQTTQPITPFRTFHLAEGPGGFIEAIANIRCNSADEYIGMTLIDDRNDNIPGWKKSKEFLLKTQNVVLEKGADGTGNILSIENLHYCFHKYSSSMDFITGDGGFDFSVNFNEQEKVMLPLLFAQVCYALLLQRKGGTFVLKIFDCFMKSTIDIIYILSSFYEKVYIMKPQTSRYANSERYIICIGFLHESNHLFSPNIIRTFEEMVCAQAVRATIPGFLSIPLQYIFIKRIEECNSVIGQQQLENIYSTINLIENKHKNDKIDFLKKTNIQRCVAWCVQHNMQYNNV